MTVDEVEIQTLVKRAERLAERELKRHEKREHGAIEDIDANRKAMRKRRQLWKQKFNTMVLLISAGSLSTLALFGTAGTKDIRSPGPLVKIERPLQASMQISINPETGNTSAANAEIYRSPVSGSESLSQIRLAPLELVIGSHRAAPRKTEPQLQTMLEEIKEEQQSGLQAPII